MLILTALCAAFFSCATSPESASEDFAAETEIPAEEVPSVFSESERPAQYPLAQYQPVNEPEPPAGEYLSNESAKLEEIQIAGEPEQGAGSANEDITADGFSDQNAPIIAAETEVFDEPQTQYLLADGAESDEEPAQDQAPLAFDGGEEFADEPLGGFFTGGETEETAADYTDGTDDPFAGMNDDEIPGIWEYEYTDFDDFEEEDDNQPSRGVIITQGQYLDVWYPESSWTYLGDVTGNTTLRYETKKREDGGALFVFRPAKTGYALLSFARYDPLSGEYIDDLLEVIVEQPRGGEPSRVRAPEYRSESAVSAFGDESGAASAEETPALAAAELAEAADAEYNPGDEINDETSLQIASANDRESESYSAASARDLLDAAENTLNGGGAQEALDMLNAYAARYTDNLDRLWFLIGAAYEADSPIRNMKKSLAAYQTVTSAYPFSPLWNAANDRIKYIQRFYFNIR